MIEDPNNVQLCCFVADFIESENMGTLRFELFKEINNLLNNQGTKDIYCDLDIRINGSVLRSTNKFLAYLLHPYLESSLPVADCLILTDTEQWVGGHKTDLNLPFSTEEESYESSNIDQQAYLLDEDKPIVSAPEIEQETAKICEFCSSQFQTERALSKHIRERHMYTYNCNNCTAIFSNKSELRKHEVKHSRSSFECPVCGIRIKHKKNLSRHLKTHDYYN